MIDELASINLDKFKNNHSFLAEELLIPNVDKSDSNRVNMFTSHIIQAVVLKTPEYPRVFTNFENQVGEYSSSYKVAKENLTIHSKIIKNSENSTYVVKNNKGFYDIIERIPGERITEYYGYCLDNKNLDTKKARDVIKKDEVIYKSTAYDDDMNFMYGINLKSVYLPYKNLTFEDGIIISESAAKKLSSYTISEVEVNINTNDILCNIYGKNYKIHKGFPDIGETVENRILLCRRRINYDSAFYDLSVKNLSKVNFNTDTPFYVDGTVIDIDVFSNTPIEKLENYPYNYQILRYLKGNLSYYTRVVEVLEPIIAKGKQYYSDNLGYLYKRAKDIIDPDVKWKNDKSDFDNIVLRFKILKEKKLTIGSKITGRYGNKGVISQIVPDSEMPRTEDGEIAEVCLNPLGVINRLNLSQLYELEINALSNYIVKNMKDMYDEDFESMVEYYFDYIYDISPTMYEPLVEYYNNLDEEESYNFWQDIFNKGIFIHQPPFYGNITFDKMAEMYDKYPGSGPKKFVNIENPLILGELYFMKLKHEPSSKFSARSSSYLNLKNIPSKSTRFKENQQLYAKTPIKIGEMELTNLLICNNVEEVVRFMSMYSINEEDRQKIIETLLTKNIFNIEMIEKSKVDSKTKQILDVFLKNIGLELVRTDENK